MCGWEGKSRVIVKVYVERQWGKYRMRFIDAGQGADWANLTGMITVEPDRGRAASKFGIDIVCYECNQSPMAEPHKHIRPHGSTS